MEPNRLGKCTTRLSKTEKKLVTATSLEKPMNSERVMSKKIVFLNYIGVNTAIYTKDGNFQQNILTFREYGSKNFS